MRIHLVTRDHTSDQILARLAAVLAGHPAFSVGPSPDPNASLNYYTPYLEWDRFRTFTATPTAAWFTHKETDRPDKERIWDECAKAVDLRLTSAVLYQRQLEPFGPTALVTPPLERERFTPPARCPVYDRPLLGTSGMIYPGGRKGEDTLELLINHFGDKLRWTAAGKGWPCETRYYDALEMPDFYRRLNVYVCTSTIEGIGYGPLEAMACGVPVVIPRGVGIFDELPDLENVHRYQPGHFRDLARALQEALDRLNEGGYNLSSLRGATARFSAEAWIGSHLAAFEHHLYDVPRYAPQYPWIGRACVYYVAYGEPARDCAERAIASFKKYMPGIPVVLASDTPLNAGEDIFIQQADLDIGARNVKTQMYDVVPSDFEFVLYLDADTEVTADISHLYQFLEDGWSMVICLNPGKYVTGTWMRRPDNEEECNETFNLIGTEEFIQPNGGVLAFRRSEATARFFHAWNKEWLRYGRRDQAALDRVLYSNPIRVYMLGVEWNTSTRYDPAERTAGILHHQTSARRWRGMLPGRLDSNESWAMLHPAYVPEEKNE